MKIQARSLFTLIQPILKPLLVLSAFGITANAMAAATPIQSAPFAIQFVKSFSWIYDDSGTGANHDVSMWRPNPAAGYYSLGDVAMGSHSAPITAISIKASTADGLAKPLDYELIWKDSGSGGTHDGSFWSPIAPNGYTCLGHIAVNGYSKPATDVMRCVRSDYVVAVTAASVWDDSGSGASWDAGVWQAQPQAGQGEALLADTFISRRSHSVGDQKFYLLNKKYVQGLGFSTRPTTKEDWELMAQKFAPQIYLHPNEKFFPGDVDTFLANTAIHTYTAGDFRETNAPLGDHDHLEANISPSFLAGKNPQTGSVPMYAVIVNKTAPTSAQYGVKPGNEIIDIVYYTFYPYNRGKYISMPMEVYKSTYYGDHVGDWEHYTVRFVDGFPFQVYMGAHTFGAYDYWGEKGQELNSDAAQGVYHGVAFSAQGSHGIYKTGGSFVYQDLVFTKLTDYTAKGPLWNPNDIRVIWHQEAGHYEAPYDWMNYGGRWGNNESACIDDINLGVTKIHVGVCRLETGPTGPNLKGASDPAALPLE